MSALDRRLVFLWNDELDSYRASRSFVHDTHIAIEVTVPNVHPSAYQAYAVKDAEREPIPGRRPGLPDTVIDWTLT